MHTQLLSAVSLVTALPGLSLLLLGTRRTKRILIPVSDEQLLAEVRRRGLANRR